MADIKLLPTSVSELIAAGEVIDRPASVIKELIENSVDSGATEITAEIQDGGISFLRVTDNGCGIVSEQARTAFLRHATSKVAAAEDLENIHTLGFRGEALASIAAVSKAELLTRRRDSDIGVKLTLHGGQVVSEEDYAGGAGTTVIIRELFYNVPARRKFLKTYGGESAAVGLVFDKQALIHPEVAFKFIRDGKVCRVTGGDGKFYSSVYSVLGREYAENMLPLRGGREGLSVTGFVSAPSFAGNTRRSQFFFVNKRPVKSASLLTALEEGYRHSIMVGKYPACVLAIDISPCDIDVNIHPTKAEVRFSEERTVFELIRGSVRAAISAADTSPTVENLILRDGVNAVNKAPAGGTASAAKSASAFPRPSSSFTAAAPPQFQQRHIFPAASAISAAVTSVTTTLPVAGNPRDDEPSDGALSKLSYVGELFNTFIICGDAETNKFYFIDKHAAHERMKFNLLKQQLKSHSQLLADMLCVTLPADLYVRLTENRA